MSKGTEKQREQQRVQYLHECERKVLKAALAWAKDGVSVPASDPKAVTRLMVQQHRLEVLHAAVCELQAAMGPGSNPVLR